MSSSLKLSPKVCCFFPHLVGEATARKKRKWGNGLQKTAHSVSGREGKGRENFEIERPGGEKRGGE